MIKIDTIEENDNFDTGLFLFDLLSFGYYYIIQLPVFLALFFMYCN